jgi:lipopolysaccharide biosynthesis protein
MAKACIFPHYFDQNHIPYYVECYVSELENYFDKILIVTNKRPIENRAEIENNKIEILLVDNQGYDFGMFYKGYKWLNGGEFDNLACINDSNILFGKIDFLFEWAQNQKVDCWGIIDADIKPEFSVHENNYHIQSHFLVFNKAAIILLDTFFDQLDTNQIFGNHTPKNIKKIIINDWEIGLSQFFIKNNLRLKTFFDYQNFSKTGNQQKPINIAIEKYVEVIEAGFPIIKKKIITSVKPKHLFARKSWATLIQKFGSDFVDKKRLIAELRQIRNRHLIRKFL